MNVKQIARECSEPSLGSYVLNVCIERIAYVSMLMSLQRLGQTCSHLFNLVYNTSVLHVKKKGEFKLVDQKWYALGPSLFVNTSI